MTDTISRPRLLSRAARAGARLYRRERDLARILPQLFGKTAVLPAIQAAEAACEKDRRAGAASYSAARHVSLLAALVAESGAARA
ncbi:MAG: DUF6477 family protein [Pikeienuella sp.]